MAPLGVPYNNRGHKMDSVLRKHLKLGVGIFIFYFIFLVIISDFINTFRAVLIYSDTLNWGKFGFSLFLQSSTRLLQYEWYVSCVWAPANLDRHYFSLFGLQNGPKPLLIILSLFIFNLYFTI